MLSKPFHSGLSTSPRRRELLGLLSTGERTLLAGSRGPPSFGSRGAQALACHLAEQKEANPTKAGDQPITGLKAALSRDLGSKASPARGSARYPQPRPGLDPRQRARHRLAIEAITGARAGSMNAVVLVESWMEGGAEAAA